MALISSNAKLLPPLKISSWRKVAIGTWRSVGDPSVYGILEFEAQPALTYLEKLKELTGQRVTLTHFVGKAVAQTLEKHPDINCILRLGKLYPRKAVDIFFQVASDTSGKDLSGATIRNANHKSIVEIAQEMQERVHQIREKGDPNFRKMKDTMGLIPGLLVSPLMSFIGFIMYTLNLWSPLFGSPKDPFGSVMITNIGSLGLDTAFAPLVPYSRVPLLLTLGVVKEKPVVKSGRVEVGQIIQICVTFDHRLIDGMHASKMVRSLQKIFANPEKELGFISESSTRYDYLALPAKELSREPAMR
jgi:pyruvate dehydrogenase E2 component (dihydrolipoamide acetyltransferase)